MPELFNVLPPTQALELLRRRVPPRAELEDVATAQALGRYEADIVVISAGSSVSARDLTAEVIGGLGEPGILVHGVSIRPGKPTILAVVGDKPVFGLPGNPVSAMIVFDLFVRPAIAWLSGCEAPPAPATTKATLSRDVPWAPGREDYVPVRLQERDGRREAHPVFGKSNLIYTLVHADGMVQVPLDKGGLYAGEEVDVRLFERRYLRGLHSSRGVGSFTRARATPIFRPC